MLAIILAAALDVWPGFDSQKIPIAIYDGKRTTLYHHPSRGYVIVARNTTKAQFQSFWGVTLAANVIYLNAADTMPQINGSETYDLRNASNVRVDGLTVSMASAGGESLKRLNGCGTPSSASSWSRTASSTGNPGTGAPAPCNKGVFLSEFSDALGTGNYIYEFVELYNDK